MLRKIVHKLSPIDLSNSCSVGIYLGKFQYYKKYGTLYNVPLLTIGEHIQNQLNEIQNTKYEEKCSFLCEIRLDAPYYPSFISHTKLLISTKDKI